MITITVKGVERVPANNPSHVPAATQVANMFIVQGKVVRHYKGVIPDEMPDDCDVAIIDITDGAGR